MSASGINRAERLLNLLQLLRRRRYPVSGQQLAGELGISLRTLYRDIASLNAQGADIRGEAGLGYVLHADNLLPPMMFSRDEMDALLLGIHWVTRHGDPALSLAAQDALAKIHAVLPECARQSVHSQSVLAGPPEQPVSTRFQAELREAIHGRYKVALIYRTAQAEASERVIWPVTLGYFDAATLLVGWCELRRAFRHFRTDRIDALRVLAQRYPSSHPALLQAWKTQQGIVVDGP